MPARSIPAILISFPAILVPAILVSKEVSNVDLLMFIASDGAERQLVFLLRIWWLLFFVAFGRDLYSTGCSVSIHFFCSIILTSLPSATCSDGFHVQCHLSGFIAQR